MRKTMCWISIIFYSRLMYRLVEGASERQSDALVLKESISKDTMLSLNENRAQMDVNAACARAQCACAPLNVSKFHSRLHVHCFKLLRWQPVCWCLVPGQQRQVDVLMCVSGCVRIDPLQDRTAFYWTADLHFERCLLPVCAVIGWTRASLLHIIFIPTQQSENYLIVKLNVWANIGQLVCVGWGL